MGRLKDYSHSPLCSFGFSIKGSLELRGVKIMVSLMYISGFPIKSCRTKAFTTKKNQISLDFYPFKLLGVTWLRWFCLSLQREGWYKELGFITVAC